MRRLIFVNRYFYPDESATSRLLSDLAFSLASDRRITIIASRQLLEDAAAALPQRETLRKVDIRRVGSTRFGRSNLAGRALDYLSFLVAAWLQLILVTRRGDVIVAKTDPPVLGLVGLLAARMRGARLVNWLQDVYPEIAEEAGLINRDGIISRLLHGLRNWTLRNAAVNVAVCEAMAERLRDEAPEAAFSVIHNWSDIPPDPSPQRDLRAELGLGDAFVLGYCGNLGRAHPTELLKSVLPDLLARGVRGLIVGGGARHADFRTELMRRDTQGQWGFLPYQPAARLVETLATPDVHLVLHDPAMEGLVFPSKLFGVLAVGRPVLHIGDTAGELAQMLHRHQCGFSVAVQDRSGLLELIDRLRNDRALLHRLGGNAQSAYREHYSRGKALARWRALLKPPSRERARGDEA